MILKLSGIVFLLSFLMLGEESFSTPPISDEHIEHAIADDYLYQISVLLENGDLDEAKSIIDEKLTQDDVVDGTHSWLRLTYLLAEYFYGIQDYQQALVHYEEALPHALSCNDTIVYLHIKNSLGLIYGFSNNLSQAFDHYVEALEVVDLVDLEANPESESLKLILLTNLITLEYSPDDKKILHYIAPTAIELAQKLNDSLHLGIIHNTLAVDYKNSDDFANALKSYRRAYDIFSDLESEFYSAHVLNNLGALYNHYGLFDSAIYYYDTSLALFEQADYMRGVLTSQLGIASVLSDTYRFDEAREIFHSIIDKSREYGFNGIRLSAYDELIGLEYFNENYKAAFDYNQKYNLLNDSLYSIESQQKYNELLSQLEMLQKEAEIDALLTQKLEAEYRVNKSRKERQFAYVIIFVLIILVVFIVLSFYQHLKANALLKDKNHQIEAKNLKLEEMNSHMQSMNKELQQSRHELMLSNHSKNRFFSLLAHDLRNPLHNASGLSFLFSKHFEKLSYDERKHYADDIYNACNQLNSLLENLLEWSRSQTNEISFKPVVFDAAMSVKNVVRMLEPLAAQKSIVIENRLVDKYMIEADRYMLDAVFRNLINNAIKYTPREGRIVVSANIDSNIFHLSVADNGIGIAKEDLRKIFRLDSEIRKPGTESEKGTGLGLVICKEFVQKHKGRIKAESNKGQGAVFHVYIPVKIE